MSVLGIQRYIVHVCTYCVPCAYLSGTDVGMAMSVFDGMMSFSDTVLFVTNNLKEEVEVVLTT